MFKLELFLPEDYPMAPPKVRFLTDIYHPNVDKLGAYLAHSSPASSTSYNQGPHRRARAAQG